MCAGSFESLISHGSGHKCDVAILGQVDVASHALNTLDAVHLVKLGARSALVCQLTGLTKQAIARLYPPLTGMSSPPGQVPFTDTWYTKNNSRMLHANVVWQLFQQFERIGCSSTHVLIHVYRAYLQIVDSPLLSLTRAFLVPRLLTINAWYKQTCDHCSTVYIGPLGSDGAICPACTEYFNHRCRSCGAAIEYRPIGRRKAACSGCYSDQKRSRAHLTYGAANGYPGF